MNYLLGALAACASAMPAGALEIVGAEAVFVDNRFELTLSTTLHAPLPRVEAVLRDYARYPQLDQRILEAKVLERAGDRVVLFTKLRACSGLVCRTVNRVERVEEAPGSLLSEVQPDRSDALAGSTRTVLTADGDRTHVAYMTQFVPNFWVPSFIGRPLMLRTLREASIELFKNVERQAAQ